MTFSLELRCFFLLCFNATLMDAQVPPVLPGEALVGDINSGKFIITLADTADLASSLLKIYETTGTLFTRSHTTLSPEMTQLRSLVLNINYQFDHINQQFSDVKALIDWTAVKVSYGTLEGNINAVSERFSTIFKVPESAMIDQKEEFLNSYKNSFSDSGFKLFYAFMNDQHVLSEGLLRPAIRYTKNDRGKMRTFMLGVLKLLLKSAVMEICYYNYTGKNGLVDYYSKIWHNRTNLVQEKMKAVDLELKNIYFSQSRIDIETFLKNVTNLLLSNGNFSQNLYQELSKKYFWRDWLVITSTHTEGRHDSHSRVCNGIIKSVYRTKDLVIDSVERTKPVVDTSEIHAFSASLNQTCKNNRYYVYCQHVLPVGKRSNDCGIFRYTDNADAIFNWFGSVKTSCDKFSSIGIIAIDKKSAYSAGPLNETSKRLYVFNIDNCTFKVHFFG